MIPSIFVVRQICMKGSDDLPENKGTVNDGSRKQQGIVRRKFIPLNVSTKPISLSMSQCISGALDGLR